MDSIKSISDLASIPTNTSKPHPRDNELTSWYEAMASAWGETLDQQAEKITTLSQEIGGQGQDDPGTITMLSAESMRMQFLSNNAANATSSVGKSLETLARKQ
ncbi:MAG: hypothetical protein CSA52_00965 [Gammaproteobacteria bacterium]|nr:MAG: hypothetical protein CSB48_08090 [Pseudomonadota bacterium]PIE38868.1 MAG: hypothetical protein CSA52_00965 [Gammaproteobacteria bacterium]